DDRGLVKVLSLAGNHFELGQLSVNGRVRIDVRVEETYSLRSDRNRRGYREPRPPRALLPRQIDTLHVVERQTTQQGDASIAGVLQIDRLFKVEPPLACDRLDTARNSRGRVD